MDRMASTQVSWAFSFSILLSTVAAQGAPYIEVPFGHYTIGPDGPWLGVEVSTEFGVFSNRPLETWTVIPYGGAYSQFTNSTNMQTYPHGINVSEEYFGAGDAQGGAFFGFFTPFLSNDFNLSYPNGPNDWPSQDWFTTRYGMWGNLSAPLNHNGDSDFENATLVNIQLKTNPGKGVQAQKNSTAVFNSSLAFWDGQATFSIKNGTAYQPSAPLLGLGGTSQGSAMPGAPLGMTAEAKKGGIIDAEFFALHMGSANEKINGSLHLGGYDKNRALGDIGIFGFQQLESLNSLTFWPQIPLVDVKLGTEVGGSPFNFTDYERSLWQFANITDFDSTLATQVGAPKQACLVSPNPAAPYIKMPQGLCSAVASYLPVTYNNDFGYYLWNTNDPAYEKIVRSPAFLEFVMQDAAKANVSVKVPMPLLNLTLEAPLNNGSKLQYFPCVDVGYSESAQDVPHHWFTLGRAFLQAAYLGVHYEQNLTIISQAPGPGLDPSKANITVVAADTRTFNGSDISLFAQTWNNSWTPLPGDTTGRPIPPSSADPESTSAAASSGISQGTKVGLGVGLGLGIPIVIAAVVGFILWRRTHKELQNEYAKTHKRGTATFDQSPPQYQEHEDGGIGAAAAAAAGVFNNDKAVATPAHGGQAVQEIDGTATTAAGVAAAAPVEMADTSGPAIMSEMPGDFTFGELPSPGPEMSRGNSHRVSEMGSLLSPRAESTIISPRTDVSPQLSPRTFGEPERSPRRFSDNESMISLDHD